MPIELEEFYQELFNEVQISAGAEGKWSEDAFFSLFCEYLIAEGELETADRAHYLPPRGMRIDGYGGDPTESAGVLSLIIADFNPSAMIETLTETDMKAIFRRGNNFLAKSLDMNFRQSLEETSPAFGLAELISFRWGQIKKVRFVLISNRTLSERVDGLEGGELDGVPFTYSVWDISRLHAYAVSGLEREPIEIDLAKDYGGAVSALPAHLGDAGYKAYLIVMPGSQLAAIYKKWGTRLLEQNVRVFLQARGAVNSGIRNTIENNPEMFFAYNNGITATAESVQTESSEVGLLIKGLQNFQIVNGGQTTASIYAANRRNFDLSQVFVQMKLSVIEPSRTMEVVPKISEYANSQNKVTAADFFANHPYHVRMEEFSRRILAPSTDGTFRQTKWFYERARGQYNDARMNLTVGQRAKFEMTYPKRQVFTKTDLAKYLNVWLGHPDIVSKGAQKNFADFAKTVKSEWENNPLDFNENYYRETVAKVIIFRTAEKLVTNQSWYQGGFRANLVAYAIAKIGYDVNNLGACIDFQSIWRAQAISSDFEEALNIASESVNQVIANPPPDKRNVTEWAKHSDCWKAIKRLRIVWPTQWFSSLVPISAVIEQTHNARQDQIVLTGIEAQIKVVNAGPNFWRKLYEWNSTRQLLTEMESGILDDAMSMRPNRLPSELQSLALIRMLKRLHDAGCQLGLDFLT